MLAHECWFLVAEDDLNAARSLLKDELFASSMFHCQQSAEKVLKAYLAFKGEYLKKTHNLVNLLESCSIYDKAFSDLLNLVKNLNPLSTQFRYPDEYEIPDKEDAEEAFIQAEEVFKFVKQKIS